MVPTVEMMTRRLCSGEVDKSMTRAGRWARAGTGVWPAWRRDPLRDGYLIAAGLWVGAIVLGIVMPGIDARTFFDHRWPAPYDVTDYASGSGFYYSPPVAFLFAPLAALGLPMFAAILTGAGLLALYGILGRWAWLGLFFPPVWWDIRAGNVNTLIGFVAVTGVARSAWWAIPLLTKITPGIGLLWFAVRREWRQLAISIGLTAGIVGASFVVAPSLWFDWIGGLVSNGAGYTGPGYFTVAIPLLPRLASAALMIAWGARTDRHWVLPLGVTLAMPVLWYSALAPLVALPKLLADDRRPRERVSRGIVLDRHQQDRLADACHARRPGGH